MADYRINADKTGPRSYAKKLQMVSYRGETINSDEGNPLVADNQVYYPPDYLASSATAVVVDSESYKNDGISLENKFGVSNPASLPIVEQFREETEVSKTLLGINRAETQQGLFDNVSSYGLDKKHWIIYSGYDEWTQSSFWSYKNSPAGPHKPTIDYDNAEGSAVVISSYPAPYTDPGNPVLGDRIRGIYSKPGPQWGQYLQSIIAMYIIEHMVNNFSVQEKQSFQISFLDAKYPKTSDGKFNRLYWDQIWLDIDQGRFEKQENIPIIPPGRIVNMVDGSINLTDFDTSIEDPTEQNPSTSYDDFFFASTRYTWEEPNQGHYKIKTNQNPDIWEEYWGIDFDSLPQDLKDWEFRVWETDPPPTSPEVKYGLPYFRITSKVPSNSLLFGSSWPRSYSDPTIPSTQGALAAGNIIGGRESGRAVVTMTSTRAFRYQPGRISGFTYGVRVSEEGAGPGSTLEFGVENPTDGYFFRLKDGTDFSIVRRSTIPLGTTQLFTEAGYEEKEVYVDQVTGTVKYKDQLTDSEVLDLEDLVAENKQVKAFETVIQQNQMNGDGLNSTGDTGYVYNPDTVTMYKIEFGWYGAIGARFYVYIPTGYGDSRWVAMHTLVIENNINQPCLADPYFFFKYRVVVDSPSRIRLPQFIEKYGASYYIDGGDEGTVTVSSGNAINRVVERVESIETQAPIYKWGSVLGLKPKQYITNSYGNQFYNKKEIFPLSMSVISTRDVEIKLVNQFGCQENAYTFQEGYRCELPESQRLRGLFSINRWQKDEGVLALLGRDTDDFTPTITYQGPDINFAESASNLGGGSFVGWDSFKKGLWGAHIIGDKLYCSYVNPLVREGNLGHSGNEVIIGRSIRDELSVGHPALSRSWTSAELNLRYPNPSYPLKISRFRKDTTLISTIPVNNNEFYLLFTTKSPSSSREDASCGDGYFDTKCDGETHFGDLTIGVIWPTLSSTGVYPQGLLDTSRTNNFAIIDPSTDSALLPFSNAANDCYIDTSETEPFVVDRTIPNSTSYRYYEGLPVDVFSKDLDDNTIRINQAARLITTAEGLEKSEGLQAGTGMAIDWQFPTIPGEDGGVCHAIYGSVGNVTSSAVFSTTNDEGEVDSGVYYLVSKDRWPTSLYKTQNGENSPQLLNLRRVSDEAIAQVTTTGDEQIAFTPQGSTVKQYYLPVSSVSDLSGWNSEEIEVSYKAISLYIPSLLKKDDRLLERRVVGAQVLPLRWFISMREGAEIGTVTVGQVTPNGIIQSPFSPHGSTLSVSHYTNEEPDSHDGPTSPAKKSIFAFTEPDALDTANGQDFSRLDVVDTSVSKIKKCPSFISNTLLSGTGFSGVGDYPIRWLKFKDSGDALASFYVSKNTPTEIDVSSIFNISAESISPSFWGNKALFAIVRSLDSEPSDGKISITINYKEQ